MTEMPPVPQPERSKSELMFELLFPGNKWDRLAPFNPLNIPIYIKRMLWTDDETSARLGAAADSDQGFAHRIDLPHPDKLTLAYEMLNMTPSDERPNRIAIFDELKQGERLGGAAQRLVAWLNYGEGHTDVGFSRPKIEGTKPYKSTIVKVYGVLDQDGKPKALIIHKEGPRPKKGKKQAAVVGSTTHIPTGAIA